MIEAADKSKEEVGRGRFGLPTPAMSRRYPNQARPPALLTFQKFVAQIYFVDVLYKCCLSCIIKKEDAELPTRILNPMYLS